MAYWRLFYHFVWATKNREPLLFAEAETLVHRCLYAEAKKLLSPLCVVGGIQDHVHVLMALRPAVSPASGVKQLKGSSSHLVTRVLKHPFEWQESYGVFSVSEHDLESVIHYIHNQKEHHLQSTIVKEWEKMASE